MGGEGAGISVIEGAEVTMDDTSIEDNISDGNSSAINSVGVLNLKGSTIITRNTAKNHSAIDSLGLSLYTKMSTYPITATCMNQVALSIVRVL